MCVGSLSRGGESIRAGGTVDVKAQKWGCVLMSGGGPRAGRPDGNRGGRPVSRRFGAWGRRRPEHPRRRGGGGSFPQKDAIRLSLSRDKRQLRSCLNHSRKRGQGSGLGPWRVNRGRREPQRHL